MPGYEHSLFLLLLLSYLMRFLPGRNQIRYLLIAAGLLLILLPPFIRIEIPWPLILFLVIPWFFWQNSRNWLRIERMIERKETFLWLGIALILTFIVVWIGDQPWTTATVFGIVASSMLWQASNYDGNANFIGKIGSLTLLFLLVETALTSGTIESHIGGILSGTGAGVVLALVCGLIARNVAMRHESIFSLSAVYLAYGTAFLIGASAITAALMFVLVYHEFYKRNRESEGMISSPGEISERLNFLVAFIIFFFLAWQIHHSLSANNWLEVALGFTVGILAAMLGRKLGISHFASSEIKNLNALKPGLFLMGMLILWPRAPELEPVFVWIALTSAILLPFLSTILLAALHDFDIEKNEEIQ